MTSEIISAPGSAEMGAKRFDASASREDARVPRADRALRAARREALDMVGDAVLFVTPALEIVEANAAAVELLTYSRRELKRLSLIDLIENDAAGTVLGQVERLLAQDVIRRGLPVRLRSKRGDASTFRLSFKRVERKGETLIVVSARTLHTTTRRQPEFPRDYLTALPTRAALDERLRKADRRSRRSRDQYAILFIDANGFKQVNDRSGHRVGDFILQAFARRLRACVRPADFVARYGGDEFVALIENVHSAAEVQKIAARIRAELKAEIEVGGGVVHVSVSVGVALGNAATTAHEALAAADRAMYRAKRRYRPAQRRSRLELLDDWT